MEEASRTGEMDFEYRYEHPESGLRWFYCKGRRFAGESRMFGIIQDITEHKHVESVLRSSRENLARAAKRRGVQTPTLQRVIGGGAPITS